MDGSRGLPPWSARPATRCQAPSSEELVAADNINERGEIVVVGVPGRCFSDFCGHLFLLTPCAIDDEQGCRDKEVETNVPFQNNLQPMAANSSLTQVHRSKDRVAAWRTLMVNRYRLYPMGAPHDSK